MLWLIQLEGGEGDETGRLRPGFTITSHDELQLYHGSTRERIRSPLSRCLVGGIAVGSGSDLQTSKRVALSAM